MNHINSSSGPTHTRAKLRRPTFARTTCADPEIAYIGPLRSTCGHVLGIAAVLNRRQWVIQWAACR